MTLLPELPAPALRETTAPILETERLLLRAPRASDAKTIADLASDRRVAENTARIPHPYSLADADEWIAFTAASAGENSDYRRSEEPMRLLQRQGRRRPPLQGERRCR